jgi:Cu(I)/Ag(I) efflux system periplasmic protein CusF
VILKRKETVMVERFLVRVALVLTIGLAPLAASAQTDDFVNGLVTKIDGSAGKITIKHGPISKFDMGPMTMVFRAADPVMLKAIKPGDRVRFVLERINGQFTITKMERAK